MVWYGILRSNIGNISLMVASSQPCLGESELSGVGDAEAGVDCGLGGRVAVQLVRQQQVAVALLQAEAAGGGRTRGAADQLPRERHHLQ